MTDAVVCGLLHGHSSSFAEETSSWRSLKGVSDVKNSFDSTLVRRDDGNWEFHCAALTSSPVLLFEEALQVSQAVIAGNKLIGFSRLQNTLYNVDLLMENGYDLDADIALSLKTSKVKNPGGLNFLGLTGSDESAFVLDDASGIFEITKEGEFVLRWRIEGTTILRVECGFGHFIAVSDTGAVYSWGSGGRGELGHGDLKIDSGKPRRIDFFDDLESIVKDVAVGGWHTLALTSDGDVYSWGWNASGQLGHEGKGVPYPVDLGDGDDPIVKVACGARHSAVLMKSGDLYTWGYNKEGQLGLGDREDQRDPQKVPCDFQSPSKGVSCTRWATLVYTNRCSM